MNASEIRTRFLGYFERQGHTVRPSSALVPGDDPTLLFTNAGMVPFKRIFLGQEDPPFAGRRATTAQKCVRAGGKHNDLEQVGHTARHHTFFEMLGNFSFGDYFKRDAIRFAWEFVTVELGIPAELLRVTVYETDDEARALWREISGLPDSRIYGLGEKDNFWQMADTGPCGPCTEIYVDLAHAARDWRFPEGATGAWTDTSLVDVPHDAFVEGAEAGRFLEIWNLVFMQFDRQPDGALKPLPKPSVDTGAGLERIAAVLQGVTNNYHTDVFAPLIATVERVVGQRYTGREDGASDESASFRVLADHARAVAFLLADGVFPSNEGRGYVLRRILRRAVRHAWLLGRKTEPTLVHVVEAVVAAMGEAYPELRQRARHLVDTTRAEEERFLATIDAGMGRFEELAPRRTTQGSTALRGTIAGEDAFRLYDTFGFPFDLTELMARERGYTVDVAGFDRALGAQRTQSQEERRSRKLTVEADVLADVAAWQLAPSAGAAGLPPTRFVGYETTSAATDAVAWRALDDGRVAVLLRETPFYAESGGQVSDRGEILGEGWRVDVDDVKKVDGRTVAIGKASGGISLGTATARVPAERRRDTERNHTATHLLHAALREVLGEHVHQRGSVVEPERLRFDFSHTAPMTPAQLDGVEARVNRVVWAGAPVRTEEKPYAEAVAQGAMALFGEKYGDRVRVVDVPGFSTELCGGTHVRSTADIGLVRIVAESGVAAGVRRIVALTGPKAFEHLRERERLLAQTAEALKAPPEQAPARALALAEERRLLERRLAEAARGGGRNQAQALVDGAERAGEVRIVAARVEADDAKALQALGDQLRDALGSGAAVLAASFPDGKHALLVVVTDDLRDRGVRADAIVRDVAAVAGGRGGGKPHMAQAGVPDGARLPDALAAAPGVVRALLGGA
jgi:alanyl-tRNA synthetase